MDMDMTVVGLSRSSLSLLHHGLSRLAALPVQPIAQTLNMFLRTAFRNSGSGEEEIEVIVTFNSQTWRRGGRKGYAELMCTGVLIMLY